MTNDEQIKIPRHAEGIRRVVMNSGVNVQRDECERHYPREAMDPLVVEYRKSFCPVSRFVEDCISARHSDVMITPCF